MLPNGWFCLYLTQNWVKTTQHFLECILGLPNLINYCDIIQNVNKFVAIFVIVTIS